MSERLGARLIAENVERFALHMAVLPMLFLALVSAPHGRAATAEYDVRLAANGAISLAAGASELVVIEPNAHEEGWKAADLSLLPLVQTADPDVMRGKLRAESGGTILFRQRVVSVPGGIQCSYVLKPEAPLRLQTLHVSVEMPVAGLVGSHFAVNGRQVAEVTSVSKATGLWSGDATTLEVSPPGRSPWRFEFARPTRCLIQDNRRWSESFVLRLGPQLPAAVDWPADREAVVEFTLSAPGGMRLGKERAWQTTATAGWIPLEEELDIVPGSSLDFSKLVPRHVPAGKFGRLVTTGGGHFAFETDPGRSVRFYGVNLCFTAQYLSHEDADRLVDQLDRIGYNAVRLHHYDNELADYGDGDEVRLEPAPLEQLDYLFAALKKRGFYITTDLFVSRKVPERVLWPGRNGVVEMNAYKFSLAVNDRAFADYRRFTELLLGHVNPHTGLSYAADPALALICLVNENNPGNALRICGAGPLGEDTRAAWKKWLGEHGHAGTDPSVLPSSLEGSTTSALFADFLADMQLRFWNRTAGLVRNELGCRALLTDMNGGTNPSPLHRLRAGFDYVDDHFYVNHPSFPEQAWSLPARFGQKDPASGSAIGGAGNAFVRVAGKPFTITEFNYAYPMQGRCASGLMTGALAGLQDWSGVWRFSYGHSRDLLRPGRASYFDIFADPVNLASERAAICLFLRGDLAPARHLAAIEASAGGASRRSPPPAWENLALVTGVASELRKASKADGGGYRLLLSDGMVSAPLEGVNASDIFSSSGGGQLVDELRRRGWLPDNGTSPDRDVFESETGQIRLDGPRRMFSVVTSCTVGVFASVPNRLDAATARLELVDAGAVWVSSLDGQSLGVARHLLVTHLTDLVNSNEVYSDEARRVLFRQGRLPHLVRDGRAVVKVLLPRRSQGRVYSLATSGRRTGEVTARTEDGFLRIPLSVNANGKAQLLYEVVVEAE
jgi:hypothetical protein